MAEYVLAYDDQMQQWIRPDDEGFTVRTVFPGTDPVLDENQRMRSIDPKPRAYTKDGVCYRHVGRIPMEVIHRFYRRTGHWPRKEDYLLLLKDRDYAKLRMTEEKF